MKLLGIDNLRGDLFIGIVAGISLIFANIVGIFSLGIPPTASVYATNLGKFATVPKLPLNMPTYETNQRLQLE